LVFAARKPGDDVAGIDLPQDPEQLNDARAGWARVGLRAFARETGLRIEGVGWGTAIADLVADLRHLGAAESGAPATVLTTSSCSEPAPENRTSSLSAKRRKNFRSVSPGRFGDLRDRGLVEPARAVELQCRLLEPAARVWLPSTLPPIVSDGSG
jgi:hypothetical protein